MYPKISIIIPIYNAENYLSQCLSSVCEQTYKNLEIICINGNSTDKSGEILQKYQRKDARIHIIEKINEGVSLSRNVGLQKATGEYVMFVDADDWIEKKTCNLAMDEAVKHNADVVMWSYMREFGDNSLPKKILEQNYYVYDTEKIKKELHRRYIGLLGKELAHVETADSLCPVWGKLYRRDIIEKNDIQFIDIRKIGTYEDGLFNLFFMQYAKKAIYVQQYWYHYRKDNQTSITAKYKPDLYEQWQYLFSYMENYIKQNNFGPEYSEALQNRICLSVLGQGLNLMESNLSPKKKINKIKKMFSTQRYRVAFKQLTLEYFPIHWKFFYGCAKYQFATGVYILLVIITKRIGTV